MSSKPHSTLSQGREKEQYILFFEEIDHALLPLVGGKGANLGELTRAGLPVPPGFCITTEAYQQVAERADLNELLDRLASKEGQTHSGEITAAIRERLLQVPFPQELADTVRGAYSSLGKGSPLAVAVRSSATAEDLPFASFAGQQDTYLNIIGIDALLDAVRRCWASLWTPRAVSYRASNHIDARSVYLAVVVQRMVNASVAGVLFTANPLTGRRHQAVIDANPGLGEAVVSGAVNPDHFVVNMDNAEIVERRLGEKRVRIRALAGGGTERIESEMQTTEPCLSDEQIVELAKLGMRTEAHFRRPQDIEWAIDDAGKLWLTQARPITTLFPLPADAPSPADDIRLYFSVNVAQGVYGPFTPMGIAFFRLLAGAGAAGAGFPPRDPLAGPAFMKEAAHRLFLDLTPMLRSTFWRPFLVQLMANMEARSGPLLERLAADPRFAPMPTSRVVVLRKVFALLARSHAAPLIYLVQALFAPKTARIRFARLQQQVRALFSAIPENASAEDRLAALERAVLQQFPVFLYSVLPLLQLIFGLPALAARLLDGLASADELQTVRRSLPYNPTTEMDLALWQVAQRLREDAAL